MNCLCCLGSSGVLSQYQFGMIWCQFAVICWYPWRRSCCRCCHVHGDGGGTPIPAAGGGGLAWLSGICSALCHAVVCGVATFMGVSGGIPIPAVSGYWLAWLPGVCCTICHAVVCSVVRLSVFWSMCCFPRLLFRLHASIRAYKVMPSCLNKFSDFVWGGHVCMQGVHIVEFIGEEYCPWTLGIVLLCHSDLEIVNFVCNVQMVLKRLLWVYVLMVLSWLLFVVVSHCSWNGCLLHFCQ